MEGEERPRKVLPPNLQPKGPSNPFGRLGRSACTHPPKQVDRPAPFWVNSLAQRRQGAKNERNLIPLVLCALASLRENKLRLALRFPTFRRADQFRLRQRRRGLEVELLLAVHFVNLDGDGILASEGALEKLFGERIFEQMLDGPA